MRVLRAVARSSCTAARRQQRWNYDDLRDYDEMVGPSAAPSGLDRATLSRLVPNIVRVGGGLGVLVRHTVDTREHKRGEVYVATAKKNLIPLAQTGLAKGIRTMAGEPLPLRKVMWQQRVSSAQQSQTGAATVDHGLAVAYLDDDFAREMFRSRHPFAGAGGLSEGQRTVFAMDGRTKTGDACFILAVDSSRKPTVLGGLLQGLLPVPSLCDVGPGDVESWMIGSPIVVAEKFRGVVTGMSHADPYNPLVHFAPFGVNTPMARAWVEDKKWQTAWGE